MPPLSKIEAELLFNDGTGKAVLFSLGSDNCLYKPTNLSALIDPFSPCAEFHLYSRETEFVNYVLDHSRVDYGKEKTR